jgi:hypothetical protein
MSFPPASTTIVGFKFTSALNRRSICGEVCPLILDLYRFIQKEFRMHTQNEVMESPIKQSGFPTFWIIYGIFFICSNKANLDLLFPFLSFFKKIKLVLFFHYYYLCFEKL